MAPKIIDCQCFCKAVGKYVGATHLSDFELTVANKLSNIIVLNIDVFGTGLALIVFG